MIKNADFDIFPLANPGIVSIPVAFFLGWLGTGLSQEEDDAKADGGRHDRQAGGDEGASRERSRHRARA